MVDLGSIIAFGHDTDERFSARQANNQTAFARERRLSLSNNSFYARVFKRLTACKANILEQLRHGIEQVKAATKPSPVVA